MRQQDERGASGRASQPTLCWPLLRRAGRRTRAVVVRPDDPESSDGAGQPQSRESQEDPRPSRERRVISLNDGTHEWH